jgi:hypothetical protein
VRSPCSAYVLSFCKDFVFFKRGATARYTLHDGYYTADKCIYT